MESLTKEKSQKKAPKAKTSRVVSSFQKHLNTISQEYLPTGGFLGQYPDEIRQKMAEERQMYGQVELIKGTPQVIESRPLQPTRLSSVRDELSDLGHNTDIDSVSNSSSYESPGDIRINTITSEAGPAHVPTLQDYPLFEEGKSIENIQKLFALLRNNENQFEVEGIKYQLDVTKHEIDEMMRAYE